MTDHFDSRVALLVYIKKQGDLPRPLNKWMQENNISRRETVYSWLRKAGWTFDGKKWVHSTTG